MTWRSKDVSSEPPFFVAGRAHTTDSHHSKNKRKRAIKRTLFESEKKIGSNGWIVNGGRERAFSSLLLLLLLLLFPYIVFPFHSKLPASQLQHFETPATRNSKRKAVFALAIRVTLSPCEHTHTHLLSSLKKGSLADDRKAKEPLENG